MLPVPWFALHQCRFHGIGRLGLSEHEVPCRIKARTERAGNQIGRRARQTNVLCYRSILNVQARSKHEPLRGRRTLHLFVPGALLPKIIRAAATSASRRMTLTVQAAALLPPRDRTGLTMYTGSNFHRSEHRHSNCPRSRCLSVGSVKSTCCAKPTQTRTAAAAARTGQRRRRDDRTLC
jgi:hypothetical protein